MTSALPIETDRLTLRRYLETDYDDGRLDARNSGSAALLKRLGLRQEAHFVSNEFLKGEWTDELVFALLADEWKS